MNIDLIIKIGGSCISNKALLHKALETQDPKDIDIALQVNTTVIYQIGSELREILNDNPRIIILTGVGSPGHFTVLKHGLHKGNNGSLEQHVGLLEAQIAVNRLRQTFLEALLHHKVPAIQLYASSIYQSDKMRIVRGDVENVKSFIEAGMIPVISGDMVPDRSLGYSVLSGDQILYNLTRHFQPRTVIFGSDVDGVFTKDPKVDPEAQLLPEISKETIDEIIKEEFERDDASGQMKGKLSEIKNLLEAGFNEVLLLNLTVEGNLTRIISNRKGIFTRIS